MSAEQKILRCLDWEKTRELYTDWVAEWGASSVIKKKLLWRGFSSWWCCNLVHKDTELHKAWYEALHYRLCGDASYTYNSPSPGFKHLTFIKLLLTDVAKWLLIKFFVPISKGGDGGVVWFHSLASNIKTEGEVACDRMYSTAHLLDNKHGMRASYLVTLLPGQKDLIHPILYRRSIREIQSKIQRPSVVLNHFITFVDLMAVHASIYFMWLKFKWLAQSQSFREGFTIDGIRCDDILIDELERSFFGNIQWSLLYAMSFEKWLKKYNRPQHIVTYAETGAYIRPVYFFSKKVDCRNQFFSIQHANFIKNKLFLYHRKTEFAQDAEWDGVRFSPMPDYYLVQGEHFKDELKSYYPVDRILIIGCLKYDKYMSVLHNRKNIEIECQRILRQDARKIMLIAPSITDFKDILDFFIGVDIPKDWRIIVSPHPFMSLAYYRAIVASMDLAGAIEFAPNIPTYKLLTVADLVVCGYSATAYEAAIFDVRAVRLFRETSCPQFDAVSAIPSFSHKQPFWDWVEPNFGDDQHARNEPHANSQLVSKLFYKADGLSADRLWQTLRALTLPDKTLQATYEN